MHRIRSGCISDVRKPFRQACRMTQEWPHHPSCSRALSLQSFLGPVTYLGTSLSVHVRRLAGRRTNVIGACPNDISVLKLQAARLRHRLPAVGETLAYYSAIRACQARGHDVNRWQTTLSQDPTKKHPRYYKGEASSRCFVCVRQRQDQGMLKYSQLVLLHVGFRLS